MINLYEVIGDLNFTGIPKVAIDLSKFLCKDFNVTLVARKVQRRLTEKDVPPNIEIISLEPKNTIDYWKSIKKKFVSLEGIVHTHDVYSLPALCTLKSRNTKLKIVYTEHGSVPLRYSEKNPSALFGILLSRYSRIYYLKIDAIVAISDYILKEVKKKAPSKNVFKIPDGVNVKRFRELTSYKIMKQNFPILLKPGAILKHKAIEFHLAAIPYMIKEFPDAQLIFAGAGSYLKYYIDMISGKKLSKYVKFLGWVEDSSMVELYHLSDIVVQADYWHGFGLPILEAMACGKPVIVRNNYAMREHILNSGAGVLIEGKHPSEISVGVKRILENYSDYSMKAVEYSKSFDWNKIAQKYKDLFYSLISK